MGITGRSEGKHGMLGVTAPFCIYLLFFIPAAIQRSLLLLSPVRSYQCWTNILRLINVHAPRCEGFARLANEVQNLALLWAKWSMPEWDRQIVRLTIIENVWNQDQFGPTLTIIESIQAPEDERVVPKISVSDSERNNKARQAWGGPRGSPPYSIHYSRYSAYLIRKGKSFIGLAQA